MSWYDIYATIRQYGTVHRFNATGEIVVNWRKHRRHSNPAACFTLQRTDKTDELKTLTELECSGGRVPLRWGRDTRTKSTNDEPSAAPETVPDQNSPKNILNALNDDCLRHIFKSEPLDHHDLCALAQTCTHFQWLAHSTFKSHYGNKPLTITHEQYSMRRLEALFLAFGQHITSIVLIDDFIFADIMLGFIAKYCPNVRQLSTSRMDFLAAKCATFKRLPSSQQAIFSAPFSRLDELNYESFKEREICSLPAIDLPNLRRFGVENMLIRDLAEIKTFFASLHGLSVLRLNRVLLHCDYNDVLECVPALSELDLNTSTCIGLTEEDEDDTLEQFVCFGRLQQMITFKYFSPYADFELQQIFNAIHVGNVPLKHVHLSAAHMEYPDNLNRMTTIESLVCQFNIGLETNLADFMKNNPNLRSIDVESGRITLDWIRRILQNARAALETAKFTIALKQWKPDLVADKLNVLQAIDQIVKSRRMNFSVAINLSGYVPKRLNMDVFDKFGDWFSFSTE